MACFPYSGTEDDISKVVEAAAPVAETESSVVAAFPGSGTEDDTSKVVEAAASVVAVSMLTSGVSVDEADESTLWSTTFVEGLATWFKVGITLSFFLLNIFPRFWECLDAAHLKSLFPILKWKKQWKKIRGWQVKIINSC